MECFVSIPLPLKSGLGVWCCSAHLCRMRCALARLSPRYIATTLFPILQLLPHPEAPNYGLHSEMHALRAMMFGTLEVLKPTADDRNLA